MKKLVPLAFIIFFLTLCLSFAAGAQSANNQPTVKRNPEVIPTLYYDVSPPLRDMQPEFTPAGEQEEAEPVGMLPQPPEAQIANDQALQSSYGPSLIPGLNLSFLGLGRDFVGPDGTFIVSAHPPDTNMDVGPNHIVQIVNFSFAIFDKTGTVLLGPRRTNSLWQGFGGTCESHNDGDPVATYDPIADRWIISQFVYTALPYMECVAVSTSPDPTGSYNRYAFSYGNTDFDDYPKLAVWPDAYYVTYNIFHGSFAFAKVCALDRARMLAGNPATQQCFNTDASHGGLLAADVDGSLPPPSGSGEYVLGLGPDDASLAYWKFQVDFSNPANTTFTGPSSIAVAPYNRACAAFVRGACIQQAGTTVRLESLGDRLMHRLAYRNLGDHESLVANHTIPAGNGTGVRWYELRIVGGDPVVFQQGTYALDGDYRWMGSIAMDQQGNIGLGFSLSGTTTNPSIHYTGRLATDPLGDMSQGEGSIVDATLSQTTSQRWGDYSFMGVDPSDDCTFWYTTEYMQSDTNAWSTQIASFTFPSCAPQQAVALNVSAPANATAGSAFDVTVTAVDGAGNTVPSYTGTVTFTTTDPDTGVVVPADYTFTTGGGGDNGVHTFSSGFVLQTPGSQTITATDTVTATITGNAPVNVN